MTGTVDAAMYNPSDSSKLLLMEIMLFQSISVLVSVPTCPMKARRQ
jgi:hypothetical protein